MEELTPLDFIAQIINSQESIAAGHTATTRWSCLREDLKLRYRRLAKNAFDDWVKDELESQQRREI